MPLIVLKFGGTSVANIARIKSSAEIVRNVRNAGNKVVVVVSAMAGTTNRLVSLCNDISTIDDDAKKFEYDAALATGEALTASLFALSLQEMNLQSRSLQGWQVQIKSNNRPTMALIEDVDIELLQKLLRKDIIPVITGFQAIDSNLQVTTLGRGGSDTTAAAIAAAIGADFCDIYTDVDGMYSSDPRLVHNAKIIEKISYEETLELAGSGAKILHPRSVEICMRYKIPMRIFSSFTTKSGTIIMSNIDEINKITAISYLKKLSLVKITNSSKSVTDLIQDMSNYGINFHQIINASSEEFIFSLQFEHLAKLKSFIANPNVGSIKILENVGSIVITGAAIRHDSKILAQILSILAENKIDLLQLVNTEIKVSIYVNDADAEICVKILHQKLIENV